MLEPNGELIFIIPSDFFKLTCAISLLNEMLDKGSFTHIFHPDNEKLFENASINVIVFRYSLNEINNGKVIYNDKEKYIINNNGMIIFNDKLLIKTDTVTINDIFDIYVGMVSGRDSIYKNNEYGNIERQK